MRSVVTRSASSWLALLTLTPLIVGCGGSSTSSPRASTAQTVTASTAFPVNVRVNVSDTAPDWGLPITVDGRVTGVGAHRTADLQFLAHGEHWRTVKQAPIQADGTYRFDLAPKRSGALRVTVARSKKISRPQPVRVRVKVSVDRTRLNPKHGRPAVLAGRVGPHAAGRDVAAETYVKGHWQRVARTQTAGDGGYRLTWQTHGRPYVRVVAAGDQRLQPTSVLAGVIGPERDGLDTGGVAMTATGPLRNALASRFDDYDLPLACGGTLGRSQQGVAHKTLPCGTLVTIVYNGRSVQVPVVDRGPYIAGREFDLTGATANALGFEGVHEILVSP